MPTAYKIKHTTRFSYPVPVSVCHNIVCLTPRPDPRLTINHTALTITPQPTVVAQRTDPFGNIIHTFSIEEPHDALVVNAVADVIVDAPPLPIGRPSALWERVAQAVADQSDPGWFEAGPFLYDSDLVARTHTARDYAALAFTPGRPILDALLALDTQVHNDFEYRSGSTHVGTTSAEALANRFGVCQDFAHVMAAALRSIGLPARYVSGYLRTYPPAGKPRLIGADQSHAWVSAYAGESLGWIDLDPTNNIPAGNDHIPIAVGRDYADIAPIRGAFLGGGESQLTVSVDVAPKSDQHQTQSLGL